MPRLFKKTRRGDGEGRASAAIKPTLADRVVRVETELGEMKRTLDVQFQRIAAMQVQLDHISARESA
jgi:hypothetical protein